MHLTTLSGWDGRLSEEITDVRWWPLTHLMEWASSWYVKGPLFVAVALLCDVLVVRRRVPLGAALTLAAVLSASTLSTFAKLVFDRPRPPLGDAGITAIGSLPRSASFPSGHATTAFAAAVALGLIRPQLRVYALAVAGLVALSRVYLGMHYAGDVVAGAMLGAAVAFMIVTAARPALRAGPAATG